eukprot:Seg435.13 transcript_id=Seg435.13/GoldUCD/mRNA.D3Y31 product="hypothetical protein" protein_id=Seg435.13/GoldUCD/D3Y31
MKMHENCCVTRISRQKIADTNFLKVSFFIVAFRIVVTFDKMGKEEEGLIKMLLLILSLHFMIDLHSSAQNINNDVWMENEKEIHKMLDRRELHHIFGTEDVAQVPAYETVHPFTVDENSKRSVNSRRSLHHTDPMFVHFTAFGFDFHLNLTLNKHLVPEGQVIEHHTNDGIKRYIGAPNTYSIGNVVSDDKSIVALDHSNGLVGIHRHTGCLRKKYSLLTGNRNKMIK